MWKSAVFVSTLAFFLASTTASAQPSAGGDLPEGPGKELVQTALFILPWRPQYHAFGRV